MKKITICHRHREIYLAHRKDGESKYGLQNDIGIQQQSNELNEKRKFNEIEKNIIA